MSETRERELVEDFLHELDGWERAYPLSSFPEPDLPKARALLEAGGMTLDAVSASNMRHVVSQIAPKARAAIEALSASTQVVREALEEAREAIGIYGYANVRGRRVRQNWAKEAIAKIDAALASLPPGGEEPSATSPSSPETARSLSGPPASS